MKNFDFDLDSLSFDEMTSLDAGANDAFAAGADFADGVAAPSEDPGFTTIWSLDV